MTVTQDLPVNSVTVFPTPGTYTIPESVYTVTEETTVPAPTTTQLPPGEAVYGGVTTVVEQSTTVVCPIAAEETQDNTITSVIHTTTYVCPTPGTYTIGASTTSVSTSTVIVFPTPAVVTPGTYTQSEQTVTVTETSYTYVCPAPETPAPTPAEPTSAPAPVETETETPAQTETPAETEKPAPKPKPKPSGGSASGNGQHFGITYTGYNNDSSCKSAGDVASDIAKIAEKGFKSVRVYSTDCDQLENIGSACKKHGLKMAVGVFIDDGGIAGAKKQVDDLIAWGQWDLVEYVLIGNEALHNGKCSAADLAQFIASCKKSLSAAGYTGPVSTAETVNIWQQYGETLCPVVDFLGVQAQPFFDGKVKASEAGQFVNSQIQLAEDACPGKEAVNTESGWPHGGTQSFGASIASVDQQAAAISSIVKNAKHTTFLFSYSDDLWKPAGIEQNFGCFSAVPNLA